MSCFVVLCVSCLAVFAWYPQCSPVLPITCATAHAAHSPRTHCQSQPPNPLPTTLRNVINICSCFHFHDGQLYPGSGLSTSTLPQHGSKILPSQKEQYQIQYFCNTRMYLDTPRYIQTWSTPTHLCVSWWTNISGWSYHISKLLYGNPLSGRLSLSSASQDPGL